MTSTVAFTLLCPVCFCVFSCWTMFHSFMTASRWLTFASFTPSTVGAELVQEGRELPCPFQQACFLLSRIFYCLHCIIFLFLGLCSMDIPGTGAEENCRSVSSSIRDNERDFSFPSWEYRWQLGNHSCHVPMHPTL